MIELTDEMKQALSGAVSDKTPVIVAYVDADLQPHISFRGSTQVHSKDQLAIWVRDPAGGMLAAIPKNAKIALMYRNPETRVAWQFLGSGHVDDSDATRKSVYESAPEVERNADPERKGKPVIIDVDKVVARGQTLMER